MGKILSVNLDAQTAKIILKQAQLNLVTPPELVREKIYEFFGIKRDRKSGFMPRYSYTVRNRYVMRIYLPDDVYEKVIKYTKEKNISIAEFIRRLFMVAVIEQS
mgnify:CR=1 FL=1